MPAFLEASRGIGAFLRTLLLTNLPNAGQTRLSRKYLPPVKGQAIWLYPVMPPPFIDSTLAGPAAKA